MKKKRKWRKCCPRTRPLADYSRPPTDLTSLLALPLSSEQSCQTSPLISSETAHLCSESLLSLRSSVQFSLCPRHGCMVDPGCEVERRRQQQSSAALSSHYSPVLLQGHGEGWGGGGQRPPCSFWPPGQTPDSWRPPTRGLLGAAVQSRLPGIQQPNARAPGLSRFLKSSRD